MKYIETEKDVTYCVTTNITGELWLVKNTENRPYINTHTEYYDKTAIFVNPGSYNWFIATPEQEFWLEECIRLEEYIKQPKLPVYEIY